MATFAPDANYRQAQWELYWMVFNGQSRLTTFRNLIIKCGISKREAAEMIQDCEREG